MYESMLKYPNNSLFGQFESLRREFDDMFGISSLPSNIRSVAPGTLSQQRQQQNQRAVPPDVDLFEDESGITLLADMPGVPKDMLELNVEGDTLVVEGSMQLQTPDGLETIYAEVRLPRYRRSFGLTRELDTAKIDAKLKDGVLTLRIPKQATAQPRRIAVSAA